jgi:hypothetical protein
MFRGLATRAHRAVNRRQHIDRDEAQRHQANAILRVAIEQASKTGLQGRADLAMLVLINAGYRPPSDDRVWNRLERLGLAYLDLSKNGDGDVELQIWRLTPAGAAYKPDD